MRERASFRLLERKKEKNSHGVVVPFTWDQLQASAVTDAKFGLSIAVFVLHISLVFHFVRL